MKKKIRISLCSIFLLLLSSGLFAYDMPLGYLGKPDDYDQNIKNFAWSFPDTVEYGDFLEQMPAYFNWADEGAVTPAKDQGHCGSCWAFAYVGAFESKILINKNEFYDLSEQQLVSCSGYGCDGGTLYAVRFWLNEGPMEESCTDYDSWDRSDVACEVLDICNNLNYNIKGDYNVPTEDIDEIKISLYKDGPAFFTYKVYKDFFIFWYEGRSDEVYTQAPSDYVSAHAVLLIGWDDAKQAWLCKNSWGENAGPNGDGTFWIAYTGHTNDLDFGMTNFKVVGHAEPQKPIADAGSHQTVRDGASVTLNASGSKDLDDGIVSYRWEQTAGTGVRLSDTSAIRPTFTAPSVGTVGITLTFKLTVTDNSNQQDTDTCDVFVIPKESPSLAVFPSSHDVGESQTTVSFAVTNAGTGTMSWSAKANVPWLLIQSGNSGTNSGTVSVYAQSNTGGARTGIITVTAPNAANSPLNVEVRQTAGTSGVYTYENMWPTLDQPWYFDCPCDVAVGNSGNVYIADSGNNCIQKFSADGNFITKWEVGTFGYLLAVAVDKQENVYVANIYGDCIYKYSSDGKDLITKWGTQGNGDGEFIQPTGLAIDNDGNVYVSDRGNSRIQKFTPDGVFISKWNVEGLGDYDYDKPNVLLMFTTGIATDVNNNVYVSDLKNQRVNKYSSNGAFIGTFAEIDSPHDIAIDINGDVFIAESARWLKKFNSSGEMIHSINIAYQARGIDISNGYLYTVDCSYNGVQKFSSDLNVLDVWGVSGQITFDSPKGIVTDKEENIYVVDNFYVKKFDADGAFIEQWGGYGSENGKFYYPYGIAIDNIEKFYIADTSNHRIQKIASDGTFIAKWGKEGSGNGEFKHPRGIATDKGNYVYVADSGNDRIQKFTSDGTFVTKWGSSGSENGNFDNPQDICVDIFGNVYVTEQYPNYRVQKFSSDGEYITKWDSDGAGIAVDKSGNIYVSESWNDRIVKYTSQGLFLTEFGETGYKAGALNSPSFLTVSPNGMIYVADSGNNRIQVFEEIDYSEKIDISPTNLNFGPLYKDESLSKSFIITNQSNTALKINSVKITETDDFKIENDNCSNISLNPSDSCTCSVIFSPDSSDKHEANIIITYNGSNTENITISGSEKDKIIVEPSSYDFGSFDVGEISYTDFGMNNIDAQKITINSISLSGVNADEFKIISDYCTNWTIEGGTTVVSNFTCCHIAFEPKSGGEKKAELVITYNDVAEYRVPLTGTAKGFGYFPDSDLWLRAVIHTEDKGPIEAVWKEGGKSMTGRGDTVIWGYFYASPSDVSWGSANNPDLFVKIWKDVSGPVYVDYFHVSVPDIDIYTDFSYDEKPDEHNRATLTDRFVEHFYINGVSDSKVQTEDGIPAAGYNPAENPAGSELINNLRIGTMINTADKGSIPGVWRQGGTDTTARGDQVVWGYFFASADTVSWGSQQNPDLFVKIWFDVGGAVFVDFFHVSVPDIEVYSELPNDGYYDNRGTTILPDRFIEHRYYR